MHSVDMQLAALKFLPDHGPDKINQLKKAFLIGTLVKIANENKVLPVPKRSVHKLSDLTIVFLQGKPIVNMRDIFRLFVVE